MFKNWRNNKLVLKLRKYILTEGFWAEVFAKVILGLLKASIVAVILMLFKIK